MKLKKLDFDNPGFKKALGIGSAIVMGIVAVANTLSDQKKEQEFEEMKKVLSELKKGGS